MRQREEQLDFVAKIKRQTGLVHALVLEQRADAAFDISTIR